MNLYSLLQSEGLDPDALPYEAGPQPSGRFEFESSARTPDRLRLPSELDEVFSFAAQEYGVDVDVLRGIAYAESRFNPDIISGKVKSPAGAIGMMQFMPETAKEYGIDPTDPVQAIIGGAAYLRKSLDKFDGDYERAVASYNWGPNRKAYDSEDWASKAPAETQKYLMTVFDAAGRFKDGAAERGLPAGVAPSKAGAGRGVVNPTMDAPVPDTGDETARLAARYKAPISERTWGEVGRDAAVSAIKSAVGLPQSIAGIADIPTFGYAGKALEAAGYRPADAQKILDDLYSDTTKARKQQVNAADGFIDTTKQLIENPSVIALTAAESAGSMLGGAGVARGLLAKAPRVAPWLAGAIGEGAVGAGSAASQIRESSADGTLTGKQVLSALGSGVGTAAIGAAGGKLAQKMGVADIDTMLAQGATKLAQSPAGFVKAVIGSGISEGVFEELPQSAQEQMWQNYATGKPVMQGVGNAAAQGMVTGIAMGVGGGGFNALASKQAPRVENQPTTPQAPAVTPNAAKTQAVDNIAAAIQEMEGAASQEPDVPQGVQTADAGPAPVDAAQQGAATGQTGTDTVDVAGQPEQAGALTEAQPVATAQAVDQAQPASPYKDLGEELAALKARSQPAPQSEATPAAQEQPATVQAQPATSVLSAEVAQMKSRNQATAAVDFAKPAPIGIGRNNTPLSEGGKPFKTKAEADTARKLQPMMRVKKEGKGFVLVEKTPAQIAAQEIAARRNLGGVGSGGGPLSAHAFLASMGGLNKSTMADLGFDRNVRVGSKWLFTNTGMTMERMTEALQQSGYVEGTEQKPAIALVSKSAKGQPQYTAEGWDQIAQAEATARFEDHLAAQQEAVMADEDFDPFVPGAIGDDFSRDDFAMAGYDTASQEDSSEFAAMLAAAQAEGIDTEAILERAAQQTQSGTYEDYRNQVRALIGAARSQRVAVVEGAGSQQGREDAQRKGSGDDRAGTGREGTPGTDGEGLTDDDGIKIRPGKGLIKGKYLAEVDGVGLPGKPFDSEAEAYDAALKYREVLAQRANEGADAQRRKEAIADKFRNGAVVTPAEIESLGLKASTSDMRWFMSRAADLFGLNSRQIRPLVKDLIKIRRSDMGTEYEYVPTRKALEAIAASQNEGLTTYTPAGVTARQDAAKEAEATAKRAEEAAARAEAAAKQASEIAQRSVAAADTFELGQSADDNLSGQGGFKFSKSTDKPSTPTTAIRTKKPDTVMVDGVKRPATDSDGNEIADSEQEIVDFWRWFGNSKVVDDQGRPMVVYHGGSREIQRFDKVGVRDAGWHGPGHYFYNNEKWAKGYGPIVKPYYLKIENPELRSTDDAVTGSHPAAVAKAQDLLNDMQTRGKDGVLAYDEDGATLADIVAFSPDQIRPAKALTKRSIAAPATPPKATTTTIRQAITKAYGNLLPRLESKGLVYLTQTEENAIADAAQARAAKIGGDVEAIKQALRKAVVAQRAWHGTPHRGIEKFSTDKIGTGEGAQAFGYGLYYASKREIAEHYLSALSRIAVPAEVAGKSPVHAALAEKVNAGADVGVAADSLRGFNWADVRAARDEIAALPRTGQLYEVDIPNDSDMLLWDRPLSEQTESVQDALKRNTPLGDAKAPWKLTGAQFYQAMARGNSSGFPQIQDDRQASEYLASLGIKGIKYLDGTSRNKPLRDVKREFLAELPEDADFAEVMDLLGTGTFSDKNEAVIKALADLDWLGFDYPAQAISTALGNQLQNFDPSPELVQAVAATQDDSTYNYVIFSGDDVQIVDVKYSQDGHLEGFFDPEIGRAYLIADGLTDQSAPGTLMHEVGIHMAADGKLQPMFERAAKLIRLGRNNPFLRRVQARLDAAGETSAEEAAAYLVTEYENSRLSAPPSVVLWVQDFIADIRAWLFSKGVLLKADQLTMADVVAVARANARWMARGDGDGIALQSQEGAAMARYEPNATPDIRRSVGGGQQTPQPQPVSNWRDSTGRLQFAPGAMLYDFIGAKASPLLSYVGLKTASPELRTQLRRMKSEVARAQEIASTVAKESSKFSEAERAMVSDLVEKTVAAGTVPPDHAVKMAELINTVMGKQTDELVSLGMLEKDTADRWRGQYLPRYYESKLLKKDAWTEAMTNLMRRASLMRGIKGKHLKGRGLFESVPVEQQADYEALGWEVRDSTFNPNKDKTVTMWRDFTPEERANMGEIRDAGFRFVMGYMQTQKDIALGRMYRAIAQDESLSSRTQTDTMTVKVPDTKVKDTSVNVYGELAGRYVSRETLSVLSSQAEAQNDVLTAYRKALGLWKEGKTVLNPVSHMNNVVSNITMAHFAGVSYHRADKYIAAITDFVRGDAMVKEAKNAGLFSGGFSEAELMQSMPEELKALAGKAEGMADKVINNAMQVMTFGLRNKMQNAYGFEDDFFKYLIYKDARERGASPDAAIDFAQRYIFTYDDLPRGARIIRDTALPFFSYTYKAVPALLHTALTQPHRFAAPAALMYAASAAAYAIDAGDDDEDWLESVQKYLVDEDFRSKAEGMREEDQNRLPPWMKGHMWTLGGVTRAIRVGYDKQLDKPVFFDISRMMPGGTLIDVSPNAGGIPLFEAVTPSHPLLSIGTAMLGNRDLFTGKDVVDETDTRMEAAGKRADWMWKQLSPAIAVGNYHYERVMNMVAQQTGEISTPFNTYTGVDRMGMPTLPEYGLPQTFGFKIKPIDLDLSEEFAKSKVEKSIREIDAEVRALQRLNNKGNVSDKVMEREREKAQIKKDRLREDLTVDGDKQ